MTNVFMCVCMYKMYVKKEQRRGHKFEGERALEESEATEWQYFYIKSQNKCLQKRL